MTRLQFPASCPHELETVGDWWRFAVSSLNRADAAFGQGTTSAEQDAAFLILGTLSLPLASFDAMQAYRLTKAEREYLFRQLSTRVVEKKPTAYILGFTEQMGVRFLVDQRVLIPRSYIGELLEARLSPWIAEPDSDLNVLDLCTGSGCLAVLAADALPNASVWASDISADAIAVAQSNLDMHGLQDDITLVQGDLFAAVTGQLFDVIVSNPPYVTQDSMDHLPPEFHHEPALALAAGEDGCEVLVRMLAEAATYLKPRGILIVDVGHNRDRVETRFPRLPFTWLITEGAEAGVFLLTREQLQ
jgi:ribosomal protein L3 glutamine methyltransferase